MANAKGEWGMSKRGTWNGEWTKRKGEANGKRTKGQKRNGQRARGKGQRAKGKGKSPEPRVKRQGQSNTQGPRAGKNQHSGIKPHL